MSFPQLQAVKKPSLIFGGKQTYKHRSFLLRLGFGTSLKKFHESKARKYFLDVAFINWQAFLEGKIDE